MSYQDEAQAGGLIDKYWLLNWIVIPLVLIGVIFGSLYFILGALNPMQQYKSNCESYGGNFWETENVDCKLFYPNCALHCNLNGETYNYYEGSICVLDCKYENEKAGGLICVC